MSNAMRILRPERASSGPCFSTDCALASPLPHICGSPARGRRDLQISASLAAQLRQPPD
jgi:hypothetical protein